MPLAFCPTGSKHKAAELKQQAAELNTSLLWLLNLLHIICNVMRSKPLQPLHTPSYTVYIHIEQRCTFSALTLFVSFVAVAATLSVQGLDVTRNMNKNERTLIYPGLFACSTCCWPFIDAVCVGHLLCHKGNWFTAHSSVRLLTTLPTKFVSPSWEQLYWRDLYIAGSRKLQLRLSTAGSKQIEVLSTLTFHINLTYCAATTYTNSWITYITIENISINDIIALMTEDIFLSIRQSHLPSQASGLILQNSVTFGFSPNTVNNFLEQLAVFTWS